VGGFCPLARCKKLGQTALKDIASSRGKTEPEIALRWSLQKGYITIPKSSTKERLVQNFSVQEWELTEEEMEKIEKLDEGFCAAVSPKQMLIPWNDVK